MITTDDHLNSMTCDPAEYNPQEIFTKTRTFPQSQLQPTLKLIGFNLACSLPNFHSYRQVGISQITEGTFRCQASQVRPKSTIFDLILAAQQESTDIDPKVMHQAFKQCSQVLKQMHSQSQYHLNIKSETIEVVEVENKDIPNFRLGQSSLVVATNDSDMLMDQNLKNLDFAELAMVILEMMTLQQWVGDRNDREQYLKFLKDQVQQMKDKHKHPSHEIKEMLDFVQNRLVDQVQQKVMYSKIVKTKQAIEKEEHTMERDYVKRRAKELSILDSSMNVKQQAEEEYKKYQQTLNEKLQASMGLRIAIQKGSSEIKQRKNTDDSDNSYYSMGEAPPQSKDAHESCFKIESEFMKQEQSVEDNDKIVEQEVLMMLSGGNESKIEEQDVQNKLQSQLIENKRESLDGYKELDLRYHDQESSKVELNAENLEQEETKEIESQKIEKETMVLKKAIQSELQKAQAPSAQNSNNNSQRTLNYSKPSNNSNSNVNNSSSNSNNAQKRSFSAARSTSQPKNSGGYKQIHFNRIKNAKKPIFDSIDTKPMFSSTQPLPVQPSKKVIKVPAQKLQNKQISSKSNKKEAYMFYFPVGDHRHMLKKKIEDDVKSIGISIASWHTDSIDLDCLVFVCLIGIDWWATKCGVEKILSFLQKFRKENVCILYLINPYGPNTGRYFNMDGYKERLSHYYLEEIYFNSKGSNPEFNLTHDNSILEAINGFRGRKMQEILQEEKLKPIHSSFVKVTTANYTIIEDF